MNLQEFEEQKHLYVCQHCGFQGLVLERNENNGGVRPICPHCGSKTPIPRVQWLAQNTSRIPRTRKADVDDVWTQNGNRCTHCARSRAFLERIGIGLNVQHILPIWADPDEKSVVVPYCTRCHQASTAEQAATRQLEGHDDTLAQIIRRIETKFPELKDDLLGP